MILNLLERNNNMNDNLTQEHIWEQRRYEAAKEFMSVIMGRANYDPLTADFCCCSCVEDKKPCNPYTYIAQISVDAADALIHELKGE